MSNYEAVVIGSSMGGMEALQTILTQLPAKYPLSVIESDGVL